MRTVFVLLAATAATGITLGVASAQQAQQLPGIAVAAPTAKAAKAKTKAKAKASASASASNSDAPAALAAPATSTTAIESLDLRAGDIGVAQSASQGVVPPGRLEAQPVYRTGEVLETVPGLIVTQHSGEGKANQYFMRGFNLDHGTDLALTIDGMPINMRTHGHGQGYADTNFLIPEVLRAIAFRKGPYFAAEGDFASAGAIHLDIHDRFERNFGTVELGSFGHRRAVAGMSAPTGGSGTVLVAGEYAQLDGPWDRPDEVERLNGVLRFSNGSASNGFALTAMAYKGDWFATSQIPQYAVDAIGRFGTLDPTDGGAAERFSLSGRWTETTATAATRVSAYVIRSDLTLYNNFTYFLDDPVNGDQFKQVDGRTIAGASASKTFFGTTPGGHRTETTLGIQTRYDDISVGLFKTKARDLLDTVRDDSVREGSVGVYGENVIRWSQWLRTSVGIRGDVYWADVESDTPQNSGSASDSMLSPKLGLVLGPWRNTELYLNAGTGFHSNDARGTVTTVDPASPMLDPVSPTPFLVRSKGAEVGIRYQPSKSLQAAAAVFLLDFDSEIVFVGDAGNTEASHPSRRIGGEFSLHARLLPWLTLDLDAAYTHARFTAGLAGERYIPGATEGVVAAGLSFDNLYGGWFGGVKVRYFGPRPLIEDNSVRSDATTTVSARLGYKLDDGLTVRLDAFNLLNQEASQIDYFYESSAFGQTREDIHFHPLEPRSFRLSVTKQW